MMTTFTKHQGQWAIRSTEELTPGQEVTVTKRNGSTTSVSVRDIIGKGEGWVLASIESDQERQTTRERKEAKADRLREWADSRDRKASQAFEKSDAISEMIPFGQPILVGHHSEGRHRRDVARIESGMSQGVEHLNKRDSFRARADGIESQLDRSIYSDDTDAIEKLRARIADLEAERDRIKAYNASCRKGARDVGLLDAKQQADLLTIAKVASFQLGKAGEMPSYVLTNLGGNINRNKKRLAELEGKAA